MFVTEQPSNKEQLNKAIENAVVEQQWVSDRLSTQVRTVAIGTLAVAWGLIVSPPMSIKMHPRALLGVAGLALLTLVADLLQYTFGYMNTTRLLNRMEKDKRVYLYSKKSCLRMLRVGCFWLKLGVALASAVLLGILLLKAILPAVQT